MRASDALYPAIKRSATEASPNDTGDVAAARAVGRKNRLRESVMKPTTRTQRAPKDKKKGAIHRRRIIHRRIWFSE
jgi:hypothetical protein